MPVHRFHALLKVCLDRDDIFPLNISYYIVVVIRILTSTFNLPDHRRHLSFALF